ncbi:AGC family protein kinase [Trichomonas vaginalis G3]|uniref:AGC family protein kinase n=1 Tax=Trichomonas vaginalis (strain ATCC PRA-98 / G3) TaxID=412133 RepID=A2FDD2_TRIV3|nr:protein serine/threonine kinase protein [Trichomonas vaginalis G3]EAX97083.1 AGC family protein kinase [Trichomonas vaginalis G3]KAI5518768.1 protein serine/threonine kinase protein [Trichomonas vaginalis G3]|eukprot:XP_001310013.1 AGC family protein kinase [Trichomonas vaginalis G3]
MSEDEHPIPTGSVTIQGSLKHKWPVLGIWDTNNYWLIGNKLYVSKTDKLEDYKEVIEITKDTNIILVDRKKNPHFIIENEKIGKYLLKSNAAEVYPWVFALRACLYTEHGYSMDQFRIISVLGRGFYGKVMLVEKLDTGKLYALKTVRKKKLIEMGQVDTIIAERNLLFSIPPHPFIISAEFAFQTPSKFYIGLEYAAGGELLHHLSNLPVVPIEDTKLYMAEVVLALQHLHTNHIVYRDLKPENVLLDKSGHVKLTDFGLCKEITEEGAKTFCGTAEYLAPEVVLRLGYGFKVDWWALGVLLYEILFAGTPFYDDNQAVLFDNIVNEEPNYPKFGHKAAIDLIKLLLQKEPENRPDFEQIKEHAFFKGIDWDKVLRKEVQPKNFRQVDELDPENFCSDFTNEPPLDSEALPASSAYRDIDGFSFGGSMNFDEPKE